MSDILSAVRDFIAALLDDSSASAPVSSRPARATRGKEPHYSSLRSLRGETVECFVDGENVVASTQKLLGQRFSPRAFVQSLRQATKSVKVTAVFTRDPKGRIRREEFEAAGIRVIEVPREVIAGRLRSNADASLCIAVGEIATRSRADCFLLISGDYDLVSAAARGIRRIHGPKAKVLCAAVPRSLSGGLQNRPDLLTAPPIHLPNTALIGANKPNSKGHNKPLWLRAAARIFNS